jgi:hypothetical protein
LQQIRTVVGCWHACPGPHHLTRQFCARPQSCVTRNRETWDPRITTNRLAPENPLYIFGQPQEPLSARGTSAKMGLTSQQLYAIEVTERLGSVLSLVSTAFVVGTFLYDKAFHKPINRLVFYASWGNIMANVGTLISTSGIDLGVGRPLCQFQAFLLQT